MKRNRPTIETTALPIDPKPFGVGWAEEVPVILTHCDEGFHKWGIKNLDGSVTPLRRDFSMMGCATDGRVTRAIDGELKDLWKKAAP